MTKEFILQKLYEKYIRPTEGNTDRFIGVEIEMPIVNLNRQAVEFAVIQELTKRFCERFGFTVAGIDDEGNAYCAEKKENGDILSYDCSYNNSAVDNCSYYNGTYYRKYDCNDYSTNNRRNNCSYSHRNNRRNKSNLHRNCS